MQMGCRYIKLRQVLQCNYRMLRRATPSMDQDWKDFLLSPVARVQLGDYLGLANFVTPSLAIAILATAMALLTSEQLCNLTKNTSFVGSNRAYPKLYECRF